MSGQTPTTGTGRFVAYTSEETTEAITASVTRTNTISATSDQIRSSKRTIYTLTTTAETSRLSTNQAARITEATSKALSTTHSRANTIETPYAERNASISPASSYVSTASSVDFTDETSTTRLVGDTTDRGQNLGWQPFHFGILGGVGLCILVLAVALILCTQRRKKLKLKKSAASDAWISRPGSSGVALTDLTFNPPLDLEKAIVDGDISTLDGLANAPAVNIFATNYVSFEADTSPSQTHVNRRATLSRKQSDGGSTPEKKGKGLTPAEIPLVSTSNPPSIGGASPKSETRSSISFDSPSNSGEDPASTANTDTPSGRSNGNSRVAPLPPDASASPPAAPAPLILTTPHQTTVLPAPPEPAATRLQTDLTAL